MGLRFYISPVIGDGLTPETAYRAKVGGTHAAMIPSKTDGSPQFNWCVATVRAANWVQADGDATLERLFGIDLPDTVDTFAELKAFLQSKTVGDIPAARRQALNTRLTNHGIDTSQVTLATTWWQLLKGIYKTLNNGVALTTDGPQI